EIWTAGGRRPPPSGTSWVGTTGCCSAGMRCPAPLAGVPARTVRPTIADLVLPGSRRLRRERDRHARAPDPAYPVPRLRSVTRGDDRPPQVSETLEQLSLLLRELVVREDACVVEPGELRDLLDNIRLSCGLGRCPMLASLDHGRSEVQDLLGHAR